MQSSLASLIVAVFNRNAVEYILRIFSLSVAQFTVKSLISSDSYKWLIEIVFVVQLQTLHAI